MEMQIIRLDCKFGIGRTVSAPFPIQGETQDEVFSLFFREYENRYKYCNDLSFSIASHKLRQEYKDWLTIENYAKHGGSMD